MVNDGLPVPVDVDVPVPVPTDGPVAETPDSASTEPTEAESTEKESPKESSPKESAPDTVVIREEMDLSGIIAQLDSLMGSVSSGNVETQAVLGKIEYSLEGVNERLSYGICVAMLVLVVWLAKLVYRHFDIFFQ